MNWCLMIYQKEHYKYPEVEEFNKRNINILFLGPAWDDWLMT